MKISIVYASQTGNTEAAAESIQDGILARYSFLQVRTMNVRDNEVTSPSWSKATRLFLARPCTSPA